ncbi:MAG: CDP-alcohol phosphatidyltransferase family protein [Candidatus Dormibacteria bacterium]|jgi:cardiolipin synthase
MAGRAPGGLRGLAGFCASSAGRLRRSRSLRRSLALWCALGLLGAEALSLAVAGLHGGGWATAILGTLVWWALIALVMAGGAAMLERPDGVAVDVYGVPNGLSAFRAWFCLPLLLCATWSLPGQLGLVLWVTVGGAVGMLDFVDGFVARRFGPVTKLGKAIDPAMDVLFFSVAAAGSAHLGILTWWLAALILFRYLAPLLLTPVVFLLGRRPELVHTVWGRRNTALIGLVLIISMLVHVAGGPVALIDLAVGLPLLVPTGLLHFAALVRRVAAAPAAGRAQPLPS